MYTVVSHLSEHVSYPKALESHSYCYDHSGFVINGAHNSHAESVFLVSRLALF